MDLNGAEVTRISNELEAATPAEILRWAWDQFGERLTMATAFGAEGCVLLHILADVAPETRVFNLDTGYQFPQTLAMAAKIKERYGITVHAIGPDPSVVAADNARRVRLHSIDPEECCRLRKVEPLKRALAGYSAWITAIRREQTIVRASARIVEWDPKFGLLKVNPLATWTRQDVWRFIAEHDVPYNPLHDAGYPSIGCMPCTRAIAGSEDERAGRWAGRLKIECGLHTR